jgi:hypothetical protein
MAKPKNTLDVFMADWAWNRANFWSKVIKPRPTDCWGWSGSNSPMGPLYGARKRAQSGEYLPQMTQARRIMYAEHTGTYPAAGMSLYHGCGNRQCLNPGHMTTTRPPSKVYKPEITYKHDYSETRYQQFIREHKHIKSQNTQELTRTN